MKVPISQMRKIFSLRTNQVVPYMVRRLRTLGFKCTPDYHGNLLAVRKTGSNITPIPMVNAHIDTVHSADGPRYRKVREDDDAPIWWHHFDEFNSPHTTKPKRVYCDTSKGVFWSPDGLGGDDRNGVIACLDLAQRYTGDMVVFLCDQEESGCIGSSRFNYTTLPPISFNVTMDRRGNADLVTSIRHNQRLCASGWWDLAHPIATSYGYKECNGASSDAQSIADQGISSINMSIGYYSPHTTNEYTVVKDLANGVEMVLNFLNNIPHTKQYKAPKPTPPKPITNTTIKKRGNKGRQNSRGITKHCCGIDYVAYGWWHPRTQKFYTWIDGPLKAKDLGWHSVRKRLFDMGVLKAHKYRAVINDDYIEKLPTSPKPNPSLPAVYSEGKLYCPHCYNDVTTFKDCGDVTCSMCWKQIDTINTTTPASYIANQQVNKVLKNKA